MEIKESDIPMLEAVSQLKDGDSAGFEFLYNYTVGTAKYIAVKLIKNEDDAMDIVHDSYITMIDKIDMLRDDAKFTAWFYKIVTNKCYDYLRKNKPVLFGEMESDEYGQVVQFEDERDEFKPEQTVDYKETKQIMNEVIESLPEDQRICVYLFYFNQLSIREIAEQMECNENTVKSRLNYAKKKMIKIVQDKEQKGICIRSINVVPFIVWMLRTDASDNVCEGAQQLLRELKEEPQFKKMSTKSSTQASAGTNLATNTAAKVFTIGKVIVTKQLITGVAVGMLFIGGGTYAYRQHQSSSKDASATAALTDMISSEPGSSQEPDETSTPVIESAAPDETIELYDDEHLAIIENGISYLCGDEKIKTQLRVDTKNLTDVNYSYLLYRAIDWGVLGTYTYDTNGITKQTVAKKFEALWNRNINTSDIAPVMEYKDGGYKVLGSDTLTEYRQTKIVEAYKTADGIELHGITYMNNDFEGEEGYSNIRNIVVYMKPNEDASYYDGYSIDSVYVMDDSEEPITQP